MRTSFLNRPTALLMSNLFGAVLYVFAASRGGWAIPAERAAGINTTTGEPLVWFLSISPIVATFFVLNLAWAVKILTGQDWRSGRFWLFGAAVWFIAVALDFAHH